MQEPHPVKIARNKCGPYTSIYGILHRNISSTFWRAGHSIFSWTYSFRTQSGGLSLTTGIRRLAFISAFCTDIRHVTSSEMLQLTHCISRHALASMHAAICVWHVHWYTMPICTEIFLSLSIWLSPIYFAPRSTCNVSTCDYITSAARHEQRHLKLVAFVHLVPTIEDTAPHCYSTVNIPGSKCPVQRSPY